MHFRKKACFTHTLEVQEEVLSFSDCSRLKKKKKKQTYCWCVLHILHLDTAEDLTEY